MGAESASEHRCDQVIAALAEVQHGVVAAWQLIREGLSRRQIAVRVELGRLHQVHRGVYAVGHRAITEDGRRMAAVLAGGKAAVLSHRDALALWGVADLRHDAIEITIPDLGSRSRPGIRVHRTRRLPSGEVTAVRGIPVTSLPRTFADIAGSIAAWHLRDAYLEAGRKGLVNLNEFEAITEAYRGKRGIRRLRRLVFEDSAPLFRTRSSLEARFATFCRRYDLPAPELNHVVAGYEIDAYWPNARLAVELDSWQFHRGRGAFEQDRAKIGDLKLAGITVIPVTHRRLETEPEKLARIIQVGLGRSAGHSEAD